MRKIWEWLKRVGAWIGGALLLLVGAGWLWRRQKSKLGRVKDELAVAESTKRIAELKAVRELLASDTDEMDEAILAIDAQLEEQRKKLAAAHENGASLSPEEIEREFARLGY